jgi:hypothetical protein
MGPSRDTVTVIVIYPQVEALHQNILPNFGNYRTGDIIRHKDYYRDDQQKCKQQAHIPSLLRCFLGVPC